MVAGARFSTHLEAKFKKAIGRTIHDEITRVRLKRVCQLLYSGDDSLTTSAQKSGYLDISHLSRLFRKNFDIWPGEYRKRARIGVAADSRLVSGLKSSEIMVR